MIPLAIDPQRTWTLELVGEDGKPFEPRIAIVSRFLTGRQSMALRDAGAEAYQRPDNECVKLMLDAMRPHVVEVLGLPSEAAPGLDGILDVLTTRQFILACFDKFRDSQYVAEQDLGKSLSPQRSAAAGSAAPAGGGSA